MWEAGFNLNLTDGRQFVGWVHRNKSKIICKKTPRSARLERGHLRFRQIRTGADTSLSIRSASGAKRPCDLNRAIQSIAAVTPKKWKYAAEMTLGLDPSLPLIRCRSREFNQVVLNMIVNGAHSIGDVLAAGGTDSRTLSILLRRNR